MCEIIQQFWTFENCLGNLQRFFTISFFVSKVAFLTGCVYFKMWKSYDLFWIWSLFLTTACVPQLRFDNNILNCIKVFFNKLFCRKTIKNVLTEQAAKRRDASDTMIKLANALDFAVDLFRLRITAAVLWGNIVIK